MTGKQLKIWQIERDISNVRLCELLGVSKRLSGSFRAVPTRARLLRQLVLDWDVFRSANIPVHAVHHITSEERLMLINKTISFKRVEMTGPYGSMQNLCVERATYWLLFVPVYTKVVKIRLMS